MTAILGVDLTDEVVATYRDGRITRAELSAWTAHRAAERAPEVEERQRVDELVLLRILDARFDDRRLGEDSAVRARLQIKRWDLSAEWLRRDVLDQLEPTDTELKAAYEKDPQSVAQPKKWRLENIFKRWPDASDVDRDDLRRTMADIRRRVVAGEDFGELAASLSDSQTASRGGRMGTVSLDQLAAPVAEVVSDMTEGSLSPVIETAAGLTLLRCAGVTQEVEPSFEEARDRLAKRLRREAFDREWEALADRLLAELDPRFSLSAVTSEARPETKVATIRSGEGRSSLTLEAFEVFLGTRKVRRRAYELPSETLQARLEEWVVLAGRAGEAERRGIASDTDFEAAVQWKLQQLRARTALDDMVATEISVVQPTRSELENLFKQKRDELVEPERLKIRALELRISQDVPAGFFEIMRRMGDELKEGRVGFNAAVPKLVPPATLRDLGWMTRNQVWLMGRNVNQAAIELQPGGSSSLVQEGQVLYILHLDQKTEERELSFEEAEPTLRNALIRARRLQAEESVRRKIIEEQDVVMVPSSGTADQVDGS